MADERQYQSLYRKYRPQGPGEVLGQEHVIRALVGAVREGRLAHAFLFCGPRGTGKTSTARILAKMVDCEMGPTPEPCGVCDQCISIRDGTHLDVVEIDAASHGGVDDARDLREKAPTAPVQGREKVYIIDEAQRLSREAFDALLKVFEEPPVGVRFVLATTEPHKMPATIIGRCQRFDFRRVPLEAIVAHLGRIAKAEGFALTPDAAQTIARQTEGSVRDALSLLDQASVLGGGEIGEEVVASLIGSGRSDVQYALADAVSAADAKAVFEIVNRMVQEGNDLRHVTSETLSHFRDLLLAKTAPEQDDLLDVADEQVERLRAQAGKFSTAELSRVISLLLAAQTDLRWTTSPRLTLELALVRATMPETDETPAALVSRIERLERRIGIQTGHAESGTEGEAAPAPRAVPARSGPGRKGAEASSAEGAESPARRAVSPDAAVPGPQEPPSSESPSEPVLGAGTADMDVATIRRSWPALIQHLRSKGKAVLPSFLARATPAAYDGETLELVFPPDSKLGVGKVGEREHELRAALQELFGISPRIECSVREAVAGLAESIEEDPPLPEEEALARLAAELGAKPASESEV